MLEWANHLAGELGACLSARNTNSPLSCLKTNTRTGQPEALRWSVCLFCGLVRVPSTIALLRVQAIGMRPNPAPHAGRLLAEFYRQGTQRFRVLSFQGGA